MTSHVFAPAISCRGPDDDCNPRWLRRGVAKRAGACVCTADHKRQCRQIRCSAPQGTAWLSPRDLRVPHTTCVHTMLPAKHTRSTQRCHVCSAHNHLRARARVRHRCLPTHPPGSRRQPCQMGQLPGSRQRCVSRICCIRALSEDTSPTYDQAIGPHNCSKAARHRLRTNRRYDTRATLVILPQPGCVTPHTGSYSGRAPLTHHEKGRKNTRI